MGKGVIEGRRRGTYLLWFAATVALALLAAVPILFALGSRPGGSGAGLSIEPRIVDLTDKVVKEGEYVSAQFRITNPLDKPVVVKAFTTSCGCMASSFEDGREPPLSIAPGEAASFNMKGFTAAQRDQIQQFYTYISCESGGRALPELTATLKCRVEDPLKAYPPSIVMGSVPPDRPTRRKIVLATRSPATSIQPPQVNISDPESIKADLIPSPSDGLNGDGLRAHYDLDVTVVPRPGSDAISGSIEVVSGDRRLSIPVECTLKRPYRLSQTTIEVEGHPGAVVSREIFYEALEPGWDAPKVLRSPEGVSAEFAPFDASTKVLKLRIRVPDPGNSPDGETTALTLGFEGRDDEIRIPIRFSGVR